MNRKMRRKLPGEFTVQKLADGAWRLSRREPTRADIFLRGADARAEDIFRRAGVGDLEIEWREDTAVLTLTSAGLSAVIQSQGAIVHEPLAHLYDALPLASFDANTERFWRRVFRLVRIPGGRHLLGFLARRTRKSR
jgi:hypothetical protein